MYLTAFATDFTIDLKGNNNLYLLNFGTRLTDFTIDLKGNNNRTTRRIYAKLTDFTIDLKGNNNNRIIFDLKGY